MRGATLLEACLAFSLVTVSVLGCLATLQIAAKLHHAVSVKTWALTQMESLADAAKHAASDDALIALLNTAKTALEKQLPSSSLFWEVQPAERIYQICFLWTLPDTQQIDFTVVPGDFH